MPVREAEASRLRQFIFSKKMPVRLVPPDNYFFILKRKIARTARTGFTPAQVTILITFKKNARTASYPLTIILITLLKKKIARVASHPPV